MADGNRIRIVAWFILIGVATGTVPLGLRLMASRGPHWLGLNNDPDYHYLVDSLHVARLKAPGHVDHPGTTVQLIGAAVIRIKHLVSGKDDLARDVLRRPESYDDAISYTLLAIHALALFAAGLIAFKATGNIFLMLLIQIGPYLSTSCLDSLARPKPESFLLSLSCFLGAMVLSFLWKRDSSKDVKAAVIFGILIGIALATKITTAPLAIIPLLILTGRRSRLTYLGVTCLSLFFLLLPVIVGGHLGRFLGFVMKLSSHTGLYGQGAAGLIDVTAYIAALRDLARYERLLFLAVLYSMGLLVWVLVTAGRAGATSDPIKSLCGGLVAVIVAFVFQIVIVAKHSLPHYLVPSLGLLGLCGALMLGILLKRRGKIGATSGAALFATICFVALAFQGPRLVGLVKMLDRCRDAQLTIAKSLEKYRGWTQISAFGASSVPLGLHTGDSYAGGEYGAILKELYPNCILYPKGMDANFSRILLRGSRLDIDAVDIKDRLEEVYSGLSPEERRWADRYGLERLYRLKGSTK